MSANAVNWSSSHFSGRAPEASRRAPFAVTLRRQVSATVGGNPLLSPRSSPSAQSAVGYLPAGLAFPSRFVSPVELESFSVPPDQSLRFDDHQGFSPVEPLRPESERNPGLLGQPLWLDLVFMIKGQLLPQEKNLCARPCARTNHTHYKPHPVQPSFQSEIDRGPNPMCGGHPKIDHRQSGSHEWRFVAWAWRET